MKTNKYDFLTPISDLFIGYCSGLGTLEAGHLVGIVNEMKTLTRQQLAGSDTDEIYDIVFTVIPAIKNQGPRHKVQDTRSKKQETRTDFLPLIFSPIYSCPCLVP